MKNLVTEYPLWAIALCPLVGLGYALLLYYRERRLSDLASVWLWVLSGLRFAAVTIIAFLILGPLVRYYKTEIEVPSVIVAIDNSESMRLGADSVKSRSALNRALSTLSDGLGDAYQLQTYTFGSKVEPGTDTTFSEPFTDIAALFESLKGRYDNRNLGAVVLASDGIYNRGANPRYALGGINAPVYTIAFGDTVHRRDVKIAEVAANRIAFMGNTFPVEAKIQASKMQGEEIRYHIRTGGKVLESGSFKAETNDEERTVRFLIDAEKPGRQTFTISVDALEGEVTRANNLKAVYVDIIDSREKILILGQAPHPDIVALREGIAQNRNYQVSVDYQNEFKGNIADYSVLILHQIPGGHTPPALIRSIAESKVPVFTIVGGQSDISLLSQIGLGISLNRSKATFNDVGATVNPGFSLFNIPEGLDAFLKEAPPLRAPFGDWRVSNAFESVLWQRVGSISTQDPLLMISTAGQQKAAVLLGEGIWRWRLYDYARNENHKIFDTFFGNIIQYLSVKPDKRFFRLQAPAESMENEPLVLTAELYNEAYEPVNDVQVEIVFTSEEGKTYPFTFSPAGVGYRLNAGTLPVGNYTYEARTSRSGKTYIESGSLTIRPFALEAATLTADHDLLRALASNSSGEMVYPDGVEALVAKIRASNNMQPVSYSTEVLSSVLNLKWPFFVILLLLTVEWFIRKRSGHY